MAAKRGSRPVGPPTKGRGVGGGRRTGGSAGTANVPPVRGRRTVTTPGQGGSKTTGGYGTGTKG